MEKEAFYDIFVGYRQRVDRLIEEHIEAFSEKNPLRDACEYALMNGGKRFRPTLTYMIAEGLNCQIDISQAALAIEYLHTASLIADDLPCMDDDAERRGKPTLHKAFDESIALMASYALISAGYGCLAKNAMQLAATPAQHSSRANEICRLSLENVSHNTGFFGATGGQFLDLYPPNIEYHTVLDVICKKTVSLFEISFVLGWLFGGGRLEALAQVKKAAYHFGIAFQIADDIDDMEEDEAGRRSMNMAAIIGKSGATKQCLQEIDQCRCLLKELEICTPELHALLSMVEHSIKQNQ